MKQRLVIAGLLLAVAIAVILFFRLRETEDEGVLSLSGNVEVTEVNVAFKMPGRVVKLFTDEGRTAAKNQKLAVLSNDEYEAQVAQNAANLRNAEVQLQKANKDYERSVDLYNKGAVSAQQRDDARAAYKAALSQVQQAKAMLRTSEVKLKDTVIYAPLSGIVLRKNVEEGETVSAGTPVFTIGDLDHPWIKVYVKEDKLGLVKLGHQARVMTDTFPGKVYQGTVTYIASEAEFTPKNVQTREERVKLVFGVKVSVKNRDSELKPGMPADVKILLQ